MRRSISCGLVRLYPRRWRDRYGSELEDLLESEGGDLRTFLDVGRAAAKQHVVNLWRNGEGVMQTYPAGTMALVRKPSAFMPILMSLCALAVVIGSVAVFGANTLRRMPDEGAAAHVWQLLMAGQIPVIAYFVFKWIARERKSGLPILALQLAGFGAALLPVWLLGL